jgi:hypothetical protein
VRPFEDAVALELVWLVRAGVPPRAVQLTVRELLVERIGQGPLGAREVSEAVEEALRAACRLAQEMDAPDEMVEAVCAAALDAVRGHGGTTARWLPEATSTARAVLDELADERGDAPMWQWLSHRLSRR